MKTRIHPNGPTLPAYSAQHASAHGAGAVSGDANAGDTFSGAKKDVRKVNLKDLSPHTPLPSHPGGALSMAVDAQRRRILTGGRDGQLRISAIDDASLLQSIDAHGGRVRSVSISDDGKLAVSAGDDGLIRVWNLDDFSCAHVFEGHEAAVHGAVFLDQDSKVASASRDGDIRVWSTETGKCLKTIETKSDRLYGLIAHPKNVHAVVAFGNRGELEFVDTHAGRTTGTFKSNTRVMDTAASTKDGAVVVTGSKDGSIAIFDAEQKTVINTIDAQQGEIRCVRLSDDEKTIISAGKDGSVKFFDIKSGRCTKSYPLSQSAVMGFEILKTEHGIEACSIDSKGTTQLWGRRIAGRNPALKKLLGKAPKEDYLKEDFDLLKKAIATLPEGLLDALAKHNYTIKVSRNRLSRNAKELKNVGFGSGDDRFHADAAEGVHSTGGGMENSIVVRSYKKDGKLHIDPWVLMHEIGHAIDLVLQADEDPMHVKEELADAFAQEHKNLPAYFHVQSEFMAETFSRYCLDPERFQRLCPQTFAALSNALPNIFDDDARVQVAAFERSTRQAPAVELSRPNLTDRVEIFERLSQQREARGVRSKPLCLSIVGEKKHGALEVAAQIGARLRHVRNPDVARFRADEDIIRISPATFNDPSELHKVLNRMAVDRIGQVLVVDDLESIHDSSAGFTVLESFVKRHGNFGGIVLIGSAQEADRFEGKLSFTQYMDVELRPFSKNVALERMRRAVAEHGMSFAPGAEEMLTLVSDRLPRDIRGITDFWTNTLKAQNQRLAKDADAYDENAIMLIDAGDIDKAVQHIPVNAYAELMGRTGQAEARKMYASLLAQIKVAQKQEEAGVRTQKPRLNLLLAGNPGTGKTTDAELLTDALVEIGFLRSPQTTHARVQDLIRDPKKSVKDLFEKNRGGVITLDEMHQLNDSAEGKEVLRLMIPYLGHKDYADTIFIGMGYTEELRELMDIDPGAERRVTFVPYNDFSDAELAEIMDGMSKGMDRVLSPEAQHAALEGIARERRRMKYFGNAGTVNSLLERASRKQAARLAEQDDFDSLEASELRGLEPDDFAPDIQYSIEDFWEEMKQVDGLDSIKERFKELELMVEFAKETEQDPWDSFEPYFAFTGPPGVGKTMVARLLGKFFYALGLLPSDHVEETAGSELQGRFVGQTSGDVKKVFERAWGGVLFMDEMSGLARAGGSFREEAVKVILQQTENNRGRFVAVMADYKEQMAEVWRMDPGLRSRFAVDWDFKALKAADAMPGLERYLGGKGLKISASIKKMQLTKMLQSLIEAPNWANGRDVRTLANAIYKTQAKAVVGARGSRRKVDAKIVSEAVFQQAIDGIVAQKTAGAEVNIREESRDASLYETRSATQVKDIKKEEPSWSPAEQRLLAAIENADAHFAKPFDADPAFQAQSEADKASEYYKKIADELGITPGEAFEEVVNVKVKVKRLIEETELIKHFVYHCPYCDQVESSSCSYFSQPERYDEAWRIAHSKKKPWTETVIHTREVEEVIQRNID